MTSNELRKKFRDFFEKNGHKWVESSSLIPNDPSVLFTTAGMQQFKPYYTGLADPVRDFGSKNTVSIQKCLRTSDIEEVGNETHLTFLEMLGNFSFGGYGKQEAIEYAYEFITKILNLKIDYVSVFEGDEQFPADEDSEKIWKNLDPNLEIRRAGREDNFWGPTGESGPCGPTTEIYINGVEVWNIVFNEYYCDSNENFIKLKQSGIDTGMGLERLALISQQKNNIYETDLFLPIISKILSLAGVAHDASNIPFSVYPRGNLGSDLTQAESIISVRVMADHIRAATFLIADGVAPSNKDRGYILRRLIRRIITRGKRIGISKIGSENFVSELAEVVIKEYAANYPELKHNHNGILAELDKEETKFRETLTAGLRKMEEYVREKEKTSHFARRVRPDFGAKSEDYVNLIPGKDAFDLYQTYGFPPELLNEELSRYGMGYHKEEFAIEVKKHQELSRTASAGMFKGGLVDHGPKTIRHHTAHHLLLAALRQVLGNHVVQRGSNVSSERLRIDFSHPEKLTKDQLEQIESLVNQKISENLEVKKEEMPKEQAEKLGALAEFGAKYGDIVSVYTIYNKDGSVFSREFCGGPHVEHTGVIGHFKILKEEAVSAGVRRIKAVIQ